MKSNIVIVGFLKELNDYVCNELSKTLEMFYANVADMISYELTNADEMITVCGIDYYKAQEEKVLKNLSNYESTIFCFDYDNFENYGHKYFAKNCHMIYLKVSEVNIDKQIQKNNDCETWSCAIDLIDFSDRNKSLESLCDVVIECNSINFQQYLKKVMTYLKNL